MNVRRSHTATMLRRRQREPQSRRTAGDPGGAGDPARVGRPIRAGARATGVERRQADVPQDRAIYTCSCGYVFAATVSTSVGCPHCGDSQAW